MSDPTIQAFSAPVSGIPVSSAFAAGPRVARTPPAGRAGAAPIRIAVVAFDGITPFHLSVPSLVFGARPGGAATGFEVRVCAADPEPLRTTAGFSIVPEYGLSELERADWVIVPTWHEDCRPAPDDLIQALRRAGERGAGLVGLCLGAFPLAQAGLLDGLRATTHWAYAGRLAERHPGVRVEREALYVDEGRVLTSAGVAAGLDCCLHLLGRLGGTGAASRAARALVVAPHRDGGQAQFIERPMPASPGEGRLARVLGWAAAHAEQPHTIDTLAARAAMSRRSFTRHFQRATGTSLKQWLLARRLERARELLEGSVLPIDAVAQAAGFGSALSLRQHFRARLRTTPTAYRRAFREGCP
jgi:transcriptional regulator GlxA family with amidase domain